MGAKLKAECGEFFFWRRLAAQAFVSFLAAYVHLNALLILYPKACKGEYFVYSLTNFYYFLALFPLLCLMWTGGRSNETDRYPVVLRYRNRREFFYIRFLARVLFAAAALISHLGALLMVGRALPVETQFVYVSSEDFAGIIGRQFLNLFCYVCILLLLYECLQDMIENPMIVVLLTALVPILDLMAAKCMLASVMSWTPWGHIGYRMFEFGEERSDYRFYWFYWGCLLAVMLFVAEGLNRGWRFVRGHTVFQRKKERVVDKAGNKVELNHVKKAYKNHVLFTDLNFAVRQGEICGIAGVNGAGKSVLLKMICGLIPPDGGEILVDGERIERGRFAQDVGVIMDNTGFLPNETGLKNLSVIAGIRRKVSREKLEVVMHKVGLDPASQVKVGKYSLGMKQRLAIAQALMEKPSLLLLDEPFNAIDLDSVEKFRKLLKRLNDQEGVTILMTSHRSEDMEGLCGSVWKIEAENLKKIEMKTNPQQ